jgi:hypothetical protein
MTPKPLRDDVVALWQTQGEEASMSLEEVRLKAQKFEKRITHRNLREYAAAAVAVAVFGFAIWKAPGPQANLLRTACGLLIAAIGYVVYQLHRRGSPPLTPLDIGLTASVDFYRRALARQRDAVDTVWSWYLLPFVPGLLVFTLAMMRRPAHGWEPLWYPRLWAGTFALLTAGLFYLGWMLNKRAAQRLQREIDGLDAP